MNRIIFLLVAVFFMANLLGQVDQQPSLNDKHNIENPDVAEKNWKIGGKIHFEEQSGCDYVGTLELNELTRQSLKEYFDVKSDSCDKNAKVLLTKENGNFFIKHRVEKSKPGIGEEMHATLLYTSKRFFGDFETLREVYDNLIQVDKNLLSEKKPPSVEQVAKSYQKIIKPDWKLEISDVVYVSGITGQGIIARLQFEGRNEIVNTEGNPVSIGLHVTLAMVDSSAVSEKEKINLVVANLKEKLLGKKIKIGNRNGIADLEFGVSGSKERIRPNP